MATGTNPQRLVLRLPMPQFALRYLATEMSFRAIDWRKNPFKSLVPVGATGYGRDYAINLRLFNFGATFMSNVRLRSWIVSVGHCWLLEVCVTNRKGSPPEPHVPLGLFEPECGIEFTLLGTLIKLKRIDSKWRFWWVVWGKTRFSLPPLEAWVTPHG